MEGDQIDKAQTVVESGGCFCTGGNKSYDSIESARLQEKDTNVDYQLLNGQWKFMLSDNPPGRNKEFQDPSYDVSGWDEITVPSNWQTEGYDYPKYTDTRLPLTRPTAVVGPENLLFATSLAIIHNDRDFAQYRFVPRPTEKGDLYAVFHELPRTLQ